MKQLASRARVLTLQSWLLVSAVGLASAVGCGKGDTPAGDDPSVAPTSTAAGETGSLSFALTQPDSLQFDTFDYAITGPHYTRSGSIDVSNSTTVSAVIEGIPVALGYSITLVGTSLAPGTVKCSGSATFDIASGAVSNAPIAVQCHLEPPKLVPIPPLAPVALGLMLLAIGARKRRQA